MFVITEFRDTVRIPPEKFKANTRDNIISEIESHYGGRVVPEVGVCICLDRLLDVDKQFNFPNKGAAFVKVTFAYIVFRPSPGDLLTGTVMYSSEKLGVMVNLGFFSSVTIPPGLLPPDSEFNDELELPSGDLLPVWEWHTQADGDTPAQRLPILPGATIRFAIESVKFTSKDDVKPVVRTEVETTEEEELTTDAAIERRLTESPMTIIGRINSDGLGPIDWYPE